MHARRLKVVMLPSWGSVGADDNHRISARGAWVSLAGILLLLVLHYAAPIRAFDIHDLLRRLFYVPVLGAAIAFGRRGGLLASAAVLLGYAPHLTKLVRAGAPTVDPALELVLLPAVGFLVGMLADSSRHQRALALGRVRLAALGEVALALTGQAERSLAAIQGQAESVRYLAEKGGAVATEFAAETIADNASRIQLFFNELHGLEHGRKRASASVDLNALTAGVVAGIQSATGFEPPSRIVLVGRWPAMRVRADAHLLAYALRGLIAALVDAKPSPRRVEVGVEREGRGAALRIRAIYDGLCPATVCSDRPEFGPGGRTDEDVRRGLSIHLLASEGREVAITRPLPNQALFTVHLAGMPRSLDSVGRWDEATTRPRSRAHGETEIP